MKARAWLIVGIVVVASVSVLRGGCLREPTKDPDERLAAHLVDLCDIARRNIDAPERGVKTLGHYLNRRAEAMLGTFGSMLAQIERIDDDERHDARAHLARKRIQAPLRACERDWQRFADAVERDPAASARLQRGIDRLGRTIEIIFSSAPDEVKLRDMWRLLGERLRA